MEGIPVSSRSSNWVAVYLPVLALLLFSRYAAAPVTDLLGDDWPILNRARAYESYPAAAATALHEPDRPLGALLLGVVFRAIDDRPALFTVHNILLHAGILALFLFCIDRLSGRRNATLIAGILFALLPHPSDLYNWATVAVYLPAFLGYLGAAACWIQYARGGVFAWAPLSGLLMFLGAATFESGFALPLAFLALVSRDRLRRDLVALAFPAAGSVLYLLWRFTRGFGLAQGILFAPRQPAADPFYLAWNAKEFVSSWAGENLLTTLAQGFTSFSTLPKWEWRGLFAATILVTLLLARALRQCPVTEPMPANVQRRAVGFAALWFIAAALPCVVSWQAGRLHFLPGIAFAWLLAIVLSNRLGRTWIPVFSLAAAMLLVSNLGSAQRWQDSGRFHRRLYQHIQRTSSEWQSAELVLFSTDSLRERLTPGLVTARSLAPTTWAKYGSADLLRGFAPAAMLRMARPGETPPISVLDVEHGARWDGDQLLWHGRWNPELTHQTARDNVHEIDVLRAATTAP